MTGPEGDHSKPQTLQTTDRADHAVFADRADFFPFFFDEILISRNRNVNKQDRLLLLLLWSRHSCRSFRWSLIRSLFKGGLNERPTCCFRAIFLYLAESWRGKKWTV